MTEIIGVRFKNGGKEYYFNPNGMGFKPGDHVIIETSRGVEFGECTQGNTMVDERTLVSPLRPVLRAATQLDAQIVENNKRKEARAFEICERKIAEHKLDMKLVEVEYNFEGSKILFFFTSDGRVDFRELVKDLASVFHTRIELRQIGVRDEAKMLGGLGICGRPFCCNQFLEDFQPVSIKMAKTQNLSLNPTKISGTCGRLMCCLKYEQAAYEDALKRCPKNESLVETPEGVGVVCQVNLLRETVKVRLDHAPDAPQYFSCEEIKVIRSGKGKRPEGYELPAPAEHSGPTSLRRTAPATPSRLRPAESRKPEPEEAVPAAEPLREKTSRRPKKGKAAPKGELSQETQAAPKREPSKKAAPKKQRPAGERAAAQESKAPGEKPEKKDAAPRRSNNYNRRPRHHRSNKPRDGAKGPAKENRAAPGGE